jgi:1-phosphofructokinase family hexose kinase
MILVVALNPALDVTHHVAGANWAGTNRPFAVHARAGGKGLNVARTLRALGRPVTLTGFAGGLTGEAVTDSLTGTGIDVRLTWIAGETRRTFTVADTVSGSAALFNEPGPAVSAQEYGQFAAAYLDALGSSAAVVLSGSVPDQLPDDVYAELIAAAGRTGVPAILDASGSALTAGVVAGPAIVKPNLSELEDVAGASLHTRAGPDLTGVERAARALITAGAGAAVASLGADGLLAVSGNEVWKASPPGPVHGNPIGAGDAVVAGLADALVAGAAWPERLRHAVALGTAAAAAPVAGEFDAADYNRLHPDVVVTVCAPAGDRRR